MIVSGCALSVPYRDACAADLRLSFALRRHAALRTTVLHLGDLAVELRVLGASHQVLVGAQGRVVVAETVACELGGDPLPAAADLTDRGWTIRFSSRVRTLGGGAFAATVRRLQEVLASCPCALAAVFPGDELAMTGLRARSLPSGGIAWRTWHAYPQTRELVTTWSSARAEDLRPRAAPSRYQLAGGGVLVRVAGRRLAAATVVLLFVSGCGSRPSPEEVRAFLDATFQADPQRANTWLSDNPVEPTADTIAGRIDPGDRFTEQQATFMRNDEYVVAVFPEGTGSRVELDDYERMRTRYLPIIAPFWGPSPGTYGPRGDRGGGFGGGGSGFGK